MLYVEFTTREPDTVMALLSLYPFEGFQEFDDSLHGYISNTDWDDLRDEILQSVSGYAAFKGVEELPEKNWNAEWESSFTPVIIDDFCAIRATFHSPISSCAHELIIDPKMAFGTGHHETTELMIRQMQKIVFSGKTVLDLGCGTGVLAILAAKCGARHVTAVDNDPEAVNNARDNARLNEVNLVCTFGTADDLVSNAFDIVLANINRNTLVEIMPEMQRVLCPGGTLVLSGILNEDREMIEQEARKQELSLIDEQSLGDWVSMQFA